MLQATVPIETLGEWVSILRRVSALGIVASVEIDSLSRREGRLTLHYHGTEDQLRLALGQDDLDLAPEEDGWWLRPRATSLEPVEPDTPVPGEGE